MSFLYTISSIFEKLIILPYSPECPIMQIYSNFISIDYQIKNSKLVWSRENYVLWGYQAWRREWNLVFGGFARKKTRNFTVENCHWQNRLSPWKISYEVISAKNHFNYSATWVANSKNWQQILCAGKFGSSPEHRWRCYKCVRIEFFCACAKNSQIHFQLSLHYWFRLEHFWPFTIFFH